MIDLKLEQPKTTDDKEMINQLEKLALGCTLHITATARHDYDMTVSNWINNFTGELAFRRHSYLTHYLKTKYRYMEAKKP